MARASGLNTGLTIRYLKQGDNLNDDSIVNNFDGWSATDSSDLAPNWSWWTAGNGLIRNFEQNRIGCGPGSSVKPPALLPEDRWRDGRCDRQGL
jgi:hypothetical protein